MSDIEKDLLDDDKPTELSIVLAEYPFLKKLTSREVSLIISAITQMILHVETPKNKFMKYLLSYANLCSKNKSPEL